LLSSTDVDGVGLTVVLVHVGVNKLNDIRAEWGHHDGRESGLPSLVAFEAKHANERTSSHGEIK
jgi:hypothetical protein